MHPPNTAISAIHWAFWILFAVAGALLALQLTWTEVVLGLVLVILGLYKIANELEQKRHAKDRELIQQVLGEIMALLRQERASLKAMESKYEKRFFRHDTKLRDSGKKANESEKAAEKSYREIVKKIVELENRLFEVSRAFLTASPRSGRGSDRK